MYPVGSYGTLCWGFIAQEPRRTAYLSMNAKTRITLIGRILKVCYQMDAQEESLGKNLQASGQAEKTNLGVKEGLCRTFRSDLQIIADDLGDPCIADPNCGLECTLPKAPLHGGGISFPQVFSLALILKKPLPFPERTFNFNVREGRYWSTTIGRKRLNQLVSPILVRALLGFTRVIPCTLYGEWESQLGEDVLYLRLRDWPHPVPIGRVEDFLREIAERLDYLVEWARPGSGWPLKLI